jgi:hypothetical protein
MSPAQDPLGLTYPDGWEPLLAVYEKRRAPLDFGPDEGLPPLDADLAALVKALLPQDPPAPAAPASNHARKAHEIALEFAGRPQICALHGVVIAHLRRRSAPPHTVALFRRLWAEHATDLIAQLSGRWLISAVITFADHGATESERVLGQSLKVLFSLMKLYEFERRFSGFDPDSPFGLRGKSSAPLPLGIEPFALKTGGLDINLLVPLWQQARVEPVLGPPVLALFDRLNADPGTLFRRLSRMRARALAREAKRGASNG